MLTDERLAELRKQAERHVKDAESMTVEFGTTFRPSPMSMWADEVLQLLAGAPSDEDLRLLAEKGTNDAAH